MKSYWKEKNVLVTGAAGFIGSHVVDLLVVYGAKVTAQVSISAQPEKIKKNLSVSLKKIKIVKADLENPGSCIKIAARQDIILNFAGLDGGSSFKREHTAEIFKINSRIIVNMLEAGRIAGVKRFLLVSSTEVYPDSVRQPIKESYGFMRGLNENIDGYVWSKRFSEIAAKMYKKQYGMEITIVRPSNIYGPRDHLNKGRVIPTFIQQALQNKPISVWNGGKQKKSFLYVTDFAVAALNLVEHYRKFNPVNIAGDRYVTIKELGKIIINVTKSKSKIKNILAKDIFFKDKILDTTRVKKESGFNEKMSFEDGLAVTVRYILNQK